MSRSFFVHVLAFVYLCAVVSLVLSCYREESVPVILRETVRRTAKFALGIAILAVVTMGIERWVID
ncbi:MAG TPA: hypothetical protein VKE69_04435 [Planctomycetota bacterium]|nr:hypothetical protein [Planctomycetota bacterium]